MRSLKNNKKGLTLIEVLVAVFLLAIASSFIFLTYTNVIESKRAEADLSKLQNIDTTLKQILIEDDVFDDIIKCVDNDKYVELVFTINNDAKKYVDTNGAQGIQGEKNGYVLMDEVYAKTSSGDILIKSKCPLLHKTLVDYLTERIDLESNECQYGEYIVTIEFGFTQVSSIRDPVLHNDLIVVTSSGKEHIYSFVNER